MSDDPLAGASDQDSTQLLALGTAAHLAGQHEQSLDLLYAAFEEFRQARRYPLALQAAFRLAMVFGTTNQDSQFNGWVARYADLLETTAGQLPERDRTVAQGYLHVLEVHRALGEGGFEQVVELSERVLHAGRSTQAPDLLTLGLIGTGRAHLGRGDIRRGLSQLDEAMAFVLAGECTQIPMGLAWCTAIEACQQVGAMERVEEWTLSLARWRRQSKEITAFEGECALHTGQVLALHGRWSEALREFSRAYDRFVHREQTYAAGAAQRERGDLLRLLGKVDEAESAYRTAAALGHEPQPGLSLLRLQQGNRSLAVKSIDRCLAEHRTRPTAALFLPAAVSIFLAVEDLPRAAEALDLLDERADASGCQCVQGWAALAHARFACASSDPVAALPYARKARRLFVRMNAHYHQAQSREVLATALWQLGDPEGARLEYQAAAEVYARVGARVDEARILARLDEKSTGSHGLSDRELEVLELTARGLSNRSISNDLGISEKTVARHLSNIFLKLGVSSRTAASTWAYQHQLLGPER